MRFGSGDLDLILRALRFDASGRVLDVEEPERPVSGVMRQGVEVDVNLDLSGV